MVPPPLPEIYIPRVVKVTKADLFAVKNPLHGARPTFFCRQKKTRKKEIASMSLSLENHLRIVHFDMSVDPQGNSDGIYLLATSFFARSAGVLYTYRVPGSGPTVVVELTSFIL
jgi:hypothetical protein